MKVDGGTGLDRQFVCTGRLEVRPQPIARQHECRLANRRPAWLDHLLARLPQIELTLLIGHHAQRHFLVGRRKPTLAQTVGGWREYSPEFIPLPHPSPRNTPWLQRNSGFGRKLLPELRKRVEGILTRGNHPDI